MYLYVEFKDLSGHIIDNEIPVHKRIKRIQLTDEQIKELTPNKVGSSCGKGIYETIVVLSLQEE
jgi:hypothetical protein